MLGTSRKELELETIKFSENVSNLVDIGIDYVGFIKWQKSSRFCNNTPKISDSVKKVGVFVDSPISEIKYSIKNNDSIEKILKNFDIQERDIKDISLKLRQKRLANINSGRELSLVLKKIENGSNSIVNLQYPIDNTSSVEVRKVKDEFIIKENILKLYKKEVVVKNTIKNNLYSSAVESGIEPNIIVEFARIFGFEVDFQRDIRQGDWFEILYEKFEDDNNKVRDTGKIIYASMFVNGEEINLSPLTNIDAYIILPVSLTLPLSSSNFS